jgi:hypothetical protein
VAADTGTAIRQGANYNGVVHRHDMTKVTSYEINPYKPTAIWGLNLIDCLYNNRQFSEKVYWIKPNGNPGAFYSDLKCNFKSSLQMYIKDTHGNPIDGASVKIYDKDENLVGDYQSYNGWVGFDKRMVEMSTPGVLTFRDYAPSVIGMTHNEIIVADGIAEGGRSVVSNTNSSMRTANVHEIASGPQPEMDCFTVTIPYITFGYCTPKSTTAHDFSNYTEHGPFTMHIFKEGYRSLSTVENFMTAYKCTTVLELDDIHFDQEGLL